MLRRFDIPKLTTAIVLVATFAMAVRVPTSPDMWWHLRCGEVQWRTRSVLKADVFSHTAAGTAWVNQSWLPQLVMYGLYRLGGFPVLALAVAALVTVTFALVLIDMRAEGRYGHFWRALITVWAAISTGRVWAARPHLITFVLTALCAYLLDRHQQGDEHRIGVLWWLPPLMLLWANSHGGYIMGFILIGMQMLGAIASAVWDREFTGLWTRIQPLGIVATLCVLAALINPQGIRLILFPFQTLSSTAQQELISEWASPDFHAADMLPFLALLLATWSALALSGRRTSGTEWVRLLGFTAIALRSGRYIGLCAIIAAPILFRHGTSIWSRERGGSGRASLPSRSARGIPLLNWVLLLLILLAASLKIVLPLNRQAIERVHRTMFPVDAVAYMRDHDLPPQILNDYGWGGYLMWELFPDVPVFIDGRADPYGDDLIRAYRQAVTAQQGWETVLDTYKVHTTLIGSNSALASVLRQCEGWYIVYEDDLAVIFVETST